VSRRSDAGDPRRRDARVVHQVASWCLTYPDEEFLRRLPMLTAAVDGLPAGTAQKGLRAFLYHSAATPLAVQQRIYVDLFDLSRKHALYLSYWTDGDTRRRGEVLGRFKQRYRASGFLVDTHGELTDFLPLVLEYAAIADPVDGPVLLQGVPGQHRAAAVRADRGRHAVRRSRRGGLLNAAGRLAGRPCGGAPDGCGRPAAGGGRARRLRPAPAAPGGGRDEGKPAVTVMLWGVLPYLMLAFWSVARFGATAMTSSAGRRARRSSTSRGCCASAARCSTSGCCS
jgi:nitrate reductase molybdenum cofactor assembly chaperone